ncbi:vWA domain-containing protein [Shewanella aestuarii]|uniref:VWA domain-containing protein n=1 Tax=Shewanella aestuarii TaxID=1028752 RepID=A0A6G9QLU7_9GAMM|nr:VWA domain-containing protein [Shewanella aestuarii]QIR15017.1 VWA domain-containing protein [Shewanella aestuarii]
MIHFIRPEWLFGIVPLLILSLLFWRRHSQQSAWKQYIAPHLSKMLISDSAEQSHRPQWLLALCWLITVIALAGPAITKQALPVFATEQGRVLVMDMSLSMYATDLSPNRLSHARFRATDFLKELKEGETGLIAYAGDAFTISPLTRDTGTLLNLLPTLSPDIMPVRGSNLSAAITLAQELLAQGGHVTGDIILMTDGVSDQQFNQVYKALDNSRYRLSILAIGSQTGAPIQLADGQLLRDSGNEVIVAQTDIALLQKLAKKGSGILIGAQADGSDITQLQQWLEADGKAKATELEGEAWKDLGPYIALLLILPILFSFKHGMLPNILIPTSLAPVLLASVLTITSLYSQPASANVWDDLWQTKAQQAQAAFDQGDYEQAAEKFDDTNWQAAAHFKAGNYQQALEGFELDTSAEGLYNQGNSLMHLTDLPQAIERYKKALSLREDFPEAKANLALAESLLEQQNQQQDQNNQQNDNQNGDQQDQSQNSQNQDKQQQGSNANQDGQQSEQQQNDDQSQQDQADPQQSQQQSADNANSEQSDSSQSQPEQTEQDKQSESNQDEADANNADNSQPSETQQDAQQSSRSAQSGADEQQEPQNEASMQANTAPNEPTEQDAEQQQQAASAKATDATDKEPNAETQTSGQTISPTDMQPQPLPDDMERALRAISEDPQVLIRNKMQLEYQKRRQSGQQIKETEQW